MEEVILRGSLSPAPGSEPWEPPAVPEEEMAVAVRDDVNARQSSDYLYIFRTEPYIDSLYIAYDENREPTEIRRFAIREGYLWDRESEWFFHDRCVKTQHCSYPGGQIDRIYEAYSAMHPEWHLKRYYTKGLRLLDHIYHCLKRNTAKEILYKSSLDELAAHIDELDELNLIAADPSEIYDGLPMRVLRSINQTDGAALLRTHQDRMFLKELGRRFPDLFAERLNDAQCRYLHMLIRGNLVVGEAGRLYRSRRADLAKIRSKSMFDIFMARERIDRRVLELCEVFGRMDPIYESYIRKVQDPFTDDRLKQLEYYLVYHRAEYDRAIRRANRKRDPEWQERQEDYIIRYPQTINDFCREALCMQNCLLAYVEAFVQNDTTILFLRRSEAVNQPFITVEIYENELKQAYHRFNENCLPEEADWIRAWCDRHGIRRGHFSFGVTHDDLF